MIRINLLPHREAKRKQKQAAFVALMSLGALAGVALVLLVGAYNASRIAVQNERNLVLKNANADLDKKITRAFDKVNKLIDDQKTGEVTGLGDEFDGDPTYKPYDEIATVQKDAGEAPKESDYTDTQRDFSDAINGLSEPLSQVAGTILH